jgi:hypothetical protein
VEEYFENIKRLIKQEGKQEVLIILRTSRLFKALPNPNDKKWKTRGQLADELNMRRERISEGLKMLKDNDLAKYDKIKRGWRKANR